MTGRNRTLAVSPGTRLNVSAPEPIFIVGAPRSGTTLLRTMLNRHSRIGLCDETYFFYYVFSRQKAFGDLRDLSRRQQVVEKYLATHRMRRLDVEPGRLESAMLADGVDYGSLFLALLRAYAEAKGKVRFGEKTPQHSFESGTLLNLYPGARLVHLVRDPRDVVASLLRMPWGSGSVAANARLWRRCVAAAEACADSPRFLRVHYERLVEGPEAELTRLCEFLGEEFEAGMLEADPRAQADKWWFQRAQEPLRKDRLERWRQELSSAQRAVTEWVAEPWLARLEYGSVGERASLLVRGEALGRELLGGLGRRLARLPSLWYHWARPTELAAEETWIDRGHRSPSRGLESQPPKSTSP